MPVDLHVYKYTIKNRSVYIPDIAALGFSSSDVGQTIIFINLETSELLSRVIESYVSVNEIIVDDDIHITPDILLVLTESGFVRGIHLKR